MGHEGSFGNAGYHIRPYCSTGQHRAIEEKQNCCSTSVMHVITVCALQVTPEVPIDAISSIPKVVTARGRSRLTAGSCYALAAIYGGSAAVGSILQASYAIVVPGMSKHVLVVGRQHEVPGLAARSASRWCNVSAEFCRTLEPT
eukprot:2783546-Rhodomonas_salina.1